MDYEYLKTILDGPDYTNLNDQDALDRLNEAAVSHYKKVDYSDVASYLRVVGKWLNLNESTLESARSFRLDMQTFNSFDLNKQRVLSFPTVRETVESSLDALIADGFIDATDKAVILSMAEDQPITRATELNLGRVRLGDIEYARSLP